MMGGLVGRYDTVGDGEDYELAEPDKVLKRYFVCSSVATAVLRNSRHHGACESSHISPF